MEAARVHLPHRVPARALTVAELVTLHGGPHDEPVCEQGPPVAVGALLRREGRAPHAFDRPTVPRGHSRPPERATAAGRAGGRRTTAATGAAVLVGAVLGTAVVNASVDARPLTTPDTGTATPAAGGTPAAGHPSRARHAADRPVSYAVPMPGAGPAGFDLPVASGASIGRGALGASPAGSTPAPGDRHPPAGAIPRPRTPVDDVPPTAARIPAVVVPSAPLRHGLGPAPALSWGPRGTPSVALSHAAVSIPAVSLGRPVRARVGPAVVVPGLRVGPVSAGWSDVAVSRAPGGRAGSVVPALSPTALTTPGPGAAEVPLPAAGPVTAVTGAVGGLAGR